MGSPNLNLHWIVLEWQSKETAQQEAQNIVLAHKTLLRYWKQVCPIYLSQLVNNLDNLRNLMQKMAIPIRPKMDKKGVYWYVTMQDFKQLKQFCAKELAKMRLIRSYHARQAQYFIKIYWAKPRSSNSSFNTYFYR